MSDRALSLSKTRSPRNSLLAAGILVAIVAVLVGFHGTTMVLSAMSLGASTEIAAKPEAAKPNGVQAAKLNSVPAAQANPTPANPTPTTVEPAQPAETSVEPIENPTGVAAAARAKALAEMDDVSPREPDARPANSRRQFRANRADKHKVY